MPGIYPSHKIYSDKLREFTKKVVENIEIPLCIYTAKILLNYQRGLGVFIDDPVQTMDDINYISLINILKSNFKENQLIMSTHEEEKANFI